jgi:hypothetical protein
MNIKFSSSCDGIILLITLFITLRYPFHIFIEFSLTKCIWVEWLTEPFMVLVKQDQSSEVRNCINGKFTPSTV